MGEHDCTRGVGEIRWIEVGNILDSDCIPCPECTSADYLGPAEAVRAAARPWVWSWPLLVPLGDSNDTAPGLAQSPAEQDWSERTAWALSQPHPLEWLGISWASLNWPHSDHDNAPEGGIVQGFPWPDDGDCAPWLAPAVAAEVCDG